MFNDVFPSSRYEILGYGEFDGEFVRILEQPYVKYDGSEDSMLSPEERVEYMDKIGFKPINKEKTAFTDGEIVISDLQKGNIIRDISGNVRVIDADAKLHTKDVGGNYTYPPVERDLPRVGDNGTNRDRLADEQAEVEREAAERRNRTAEIVDEGLFSDEEREQAIIEESAKLGVKVRVAHSTDELDADAQKDIAKGKPIKGYYDTRTGEVEARNAASRLGMTLEERRASLASETEDVAREDQIFLRDAVENAVIGNGKPFGPDNPYNNKRKATRAQRDEIVKAILHEGYDSVGTDVVKVGNYLFLIDHTDNSEFQNILDTEKNPDGQGYGIRKKYTFANITEEDIYEIVTNIAKSYSYNEGSIRVRLQELGFEPTALSKFDFNAAIVGGNRDNGVGTERGRRQRDATHSNTGSSDGRIHKGGILGGDGGKIRDRLADDQAEIERASERRNRTAEIVDEGPFSDEEREQAIIGESAKLGVKVRVAHSTDELDADAQKDIAKGKPVKGYYDTRNG